MYIIRAKKVKSIHKYHYLANILKTFFEFLKNISITYSTVYIKAEIFTSISSKHMKEPQKGLPDCLFLFWMTFLITKEVSGTVPSQGS